MTAPSQASNRLLSTLLWFASGGVVATTMLYLWPFPILLQFTLLFAAFAIFTVMKVGYQKPIRPLAFLVGSLLPYVISNLWLDSLGSNRIDEKDMPPPPALSSEQTGK